jgi:hypothetical protein
MRDENVRGEGTVSEFSLQGVPQDPESRAAVKDINLISNAHFDAGGVSSVAQVLGLWSGRGSPHAPKLDLHTLFSQSSRLQESSQQFDRYLARVAAAARLQRLSGIERR